MRSGAVLSLCFLGAALALAGCTLTPPAPEPPSLPRIASDARLHSIWYRQPQHTRPADYTQPAALVHDGRVYHAELPDRIVAFDAVTGRQAWRTTLPTAEGERQVVINAHLGAGAGLVFAGTRQGRVIALDPATGEVRWEARLASEVAAPPVAQGRYVIARSNDGRIYGLEAGSGRELWVQVGVVPPLSLRGAGRPLVDQGQVYVGLANGRLIAAALDTGEVVWETAIGIPEGRSEFERLVDVDADLAMRDATVFAAAYQARLAAVSAVSGRVQWSRDLSTYHPLLLREGVLYVSSDDAEILAIDAGNGVVLWRQPGLAGRRITAPVAFGDEVLVADDLGYIHGLSPEDGHFVLRQRLSEAAIITAPAVAGDVMYVVDSAGALQALRRMEEGS